eukprot:CAMPEP_0202702044 /NCGR_PEP_ID=MMETSP1385-20130828/15080_1 /ASSEMBLY_ACC=CAM_ASM_000861 /TAXON_ID=933848 /ORGANISM="Elphidium margaritaceum" /LENGTH=555 /DNA_ID=CAMNT_0049359605 /DNA_START=35 /DNA_END=1702 /DNA_ORIENTATION=-
MDLDQVDSTEQSTEQQPETLQQEPLQSTSSMPGSQPEQAPVDMDSSAPDLVTNHVPDSEPAPPSQPFGQDSLQAPISSELNTEHAMPIQQVSEERNEEAATMAGQPMQEAEAATYAERAEVVEQTSFLPTSDTPAETADATPNESQAPMSALQAAPVTMAQEVTSTAQALPEQQEPKQEQEPPQQAVQQSADDTPRPMQAEYNIAHQQEPVPEASYPQVTAPQVDAFDETVAQAQAHPPQAPPEEQAPQAEVDNAMEVEPRDQQQQKTEAAHALDVEMHENENENAENEAPITTASTTTAGKQELPSAEASEAVRVTRASQRNASKASNGDGAAAGVRRPELSSSTGTAPELEECRKLLAEYMHRPESEAFNEPVDWKGLDLPDYPMIITKPMDLGTIAGKLGNRRYSSADAFASDIRLVFNNAKKYNTPGSGIYMIAENLLKQFERRFARITKDNSLSGKKRKSAEKAKGVHGDGQESSYKDRQRFTEFLQSLSAQELGAIVELIDKKSPQALNSSSEDNEELEIEVYHIESSILKELITYSEKLIAKRQKKKK